METAAAERRHHGSLPDRRQKSTIPRVSLIALFADPYRRISVLLLTLVLCASIIGIVLLQYVQSALVERAGHSFELAAADSADKLDRLMFERYGDIQMLAYTAAVDMHNPSHLSAYLARMKEVYPLYVWLAVTDATGTIIASTDALWIGQDRRLTNWFKAVQSHPRIVVQDVQPYPEAAGLQAVSFSAPVASPDGTFQGVVTALVGLPTLSDLFQQVQQVFPSHVGPLIQPEYLFIARNGETVIDLLAREEVRANLSELPSVGRLKASPSPGYVEEWTVRGHRRVITGYAQTKGYAEFPGLSWGVLVRANREDVLAPITKVTVKIALAGLAIMLPALTLLVWTSVRLRKEDEQLRESEEALRRTQEELEQRVQERTEELQAKQAQLIQSAKLASLGELASGIAHELNNPLNNIGLFAGNAEEYLNQGHTNLQPVMNHLDQIQGQVRRAAGIIDHVRTFARTASPSREQVSINEVIRQSLLLVDEQLRLHNITIVLNLDESLPSVAGNRIQLEQIFVNLFTNARDAMQPAGKRVLTIATRMEEETVCITIADTGTGIPPDVLPRIFDPFFTTKPVGEGTGLGLSITYGIVKEHQGTIEVTSTKEVGTTFTIHMPIIPHTTGAISTEQAEQVEQS